MDKVILALDLGTTGNRVIAFSKTGEIKAQAYFEFPQIFPEPGWVEHNPSDILDTTFKALKEVLAVVGPENVDSIGITNQRETTILWDKNTGNTVYNAIVWQCRRTKDICRRKRHATQTFKEKTGLPLDPYFSGTKITWLLENIDGLRTGAENGDILFGTVDTWLIWNLTREKVHVTDSTNASRTLLFNIKTLAWDDELLDILEIPKSILPQVKPGNSQFGMTDPEITGKAIPITGVLGDQQASLFAHSCLEKGVVKNTYGTGLFVMSSTGTVLAPGENLVNTIAWQLDNEITYAMEGSIFSGGSCVQWIRDGLKIIDSPGQTDKMAKSVKDNGGVYFVPALSGLGAPYWDPNARGTIIGITGGTTKEHIARAVLESVAYQTRDVIEEIKKNTGLEFRKISVDGGLTRNDFLMQFQADILGIPVEKPRISDMTALGAAGIAGLTSGFWTIDQFKKTRQVEKVYHPDMPESTRKNLYSKWKKAVQRSLNWES